MDEREKHIDQLIYLMASHRGILASEMRTPQLCEIAKAWQRDRDELKLLRRDKEEPK